MNIKMFMSALLVILSAADLYADAPVPKKDLGDLVRGHRHTTFFVPRGKTGASKDIVLPDTQEVAVSAFRDFIRPNLLACITRNSKGGAWETLIIDLNNNRDLTDDEPYKIPPPKTPWDLKLTCNGGVHQVRAGLIPQGSGAVMNIYSTMGWRGMTAVGEKAVTWAVIDCSLDGKVDEMDAAYIDINADDQLDPMSERLTLNAQAMLTFEGKWYNVVADSSSNQLKIQPYAGKMYKLAFDESKILPDNKLPISLSLAYRDGKRASAADARKGSDWSFPEGTFSYISGTIALPEYPLRFSLRNFSLNKDTLLVLEKPELHVSVNRAKGKLSVNRRVAAPHGVSYSLKRGKPGPAIECFSAGDMTKPFVKGNMSYG